MESSLWVPQPSSRAINSHTNTFLLPPLFSSSLEPATVPPPFKPSQHSTGNDSTTKLLKEEEGGDKVVFDTSGEMPVSFDNSLVNEEEEPAKKEVFEKEEKELTEVIKGPKSSTLLAAT
ncbi:Uncharacterized protein Rs2_50277 [Raphanus sativus]|nr:Uncharacterized protein Rs2_50277 [Raphanus sativus]